MRVKNLERLSLFKLQSQRIGVGKTMLLLPRLSLTPGPCDGWEARNTIQSMPLLQHNICHNTPISQDISFIIGICHNTPIAQDISFIIGICILPRCIANYHQETLVISNLSTNEIYFNFMYDFTYTYSSLLSQKYGIPKTKII